MAEAELLQDGLRTEFGARWLLEWNALGGSLRLGFNADGSITRVFPARPRADLVAEDHYRVLVLERSFDPGPVIAALDAVKGVLRSIPPQQAVNDQGDPAFA